MEKNHLQFSAEKVVKGRDLYILAERRLAFILYLSFIFLTTDGSMQKSKI